ncbi:hypothetical protein ACTFIV_006895 [Dictyostelium citrinum]
MIKNENSNDIYKSLDLNEKDLYYYNQSIGIIGIVDSGNSIIQDDKHQQQQSCIEITKRKYGETKLKLTIDTNSTPFKLIRSSDLTCLTDIDFNSIHNSNSFDYILEESNKNHQLTKALLKSINFLNNNYPTIFNKYNHLNHFTVNFNENHGYLSSFTYSNNNNNNNNNSFDEINNENNLISNYDLLKLFINKSKEDGSSSQVIEYQISILFSVSILYWLIITKEITNNNNINNKNKVVEIQPKNIIHRIVLHKLTSYILSMTQQDYLCLIKALQISKGLVDSNNLFIDYIESIKTINQESIELFEKLRISQTLNTIELEEWLLLNGSNNNNIDSFSSIENDSSSSYEKLINRLIENVINKYDSRVSWYLKSLKIDYCYDRQSLKRSLSIDDVAERRESTYQVIKRFNSKVEERNSILLANEIRDSINSPGFPNDWDKIIVSGRESRAFSNQATLFAASSMIKVSQSIKTLIFQIKDLISLNYFLKQFDQQIINNNNNNNSSMNELKLKLSETLKHLLATSGRFQSISSKKVISITQIQGAIIQLKETITIVYGKCYQIIDDHNSKFINFHGEGSTRSLLMTQYQQQQSNQYYQMIYRIIDGLFARGYGDVWRSVQSLEQEILSARKESTGYSVLLQRPSFSGSERFRTNDLEPKPEQEDSLQKLIRIGGENIHMSPSNCWVEHTTDLIEAVPLFIYERTHITDDGKSETVFEVDQEGLEQTIRSLADPWSKNIKITMLTEHLSLARELLVKHSSTLLEQSFKLYQENFGILEFEQIYRKLLISQKDDIIKLALLLEQEYQENLYEQVEANIFENWKQSKFITRIESLKQLIQSKELELIERSKKFNLSSLKDTAKLSQLQYYSLKKQRGLPGFHLLTTEAPGLVEGFIQAVLEEEMCLNNIIEHYHGLPQLVEKKLNQYQKDLYLVGCKIINEFNYQPIVEQRQNHLKISHQRAISSIVSDHLIIQKQVSLLLILFELEKIDDSLSESSIDFHLEDRIQSEPKSVIEILNSSKYYKEFQDLGIETIYQQNKNEKDFLCSSSTTNANINLSKEEVSIIIKSKQPYKNELKYFIQWEARYRALELIDKKKPELFILKRLEKYYRNHSALSLTTARRSVISENGLLNQLNNPLFAFSCGAVIGGGENGGEVRPTGMRKRYHFIYGPSRVNLGKDERKSVETWPQFLGVTDPLCAKHAYRFYSLINYNPIIRTITAAENLKVSENQNTALIRSVRNVQALFVERLSVGDIEDLSYQFNQRGGLSIALGKESESFSAGPTAGYCIPKDLLFKLFVVTHQDSRKLSMIGIPSHLHQQIIQMMIEISTRQWQFPSIGEWENWAANQFTNPDPNDPDCLLNKFCGSIHSNQVSKYMKQYIQVTGGIVCLHVSKMCQILGTIGIPSPLINGWRRGGGSIDNNISGGSSSLPSSCHSTVWSNWAEKKVTLGGEQVNRSVVFPMTIEIPESGKESIKLNPLVKNFPKETELRVHMFGVYKGDDNEKPPPDVRFAWVMRAFLILSGHMEEVSMSLDEEGQLVARLTWNGFQPNSKHHQDIAIRKYLAQQFIGNGVLDFDEHNNREHQEIVDKLVERFPQHTTVGDITITSVPGVDSSDLLNFSSESLSLLEDDANEAAEILKRYGISMDQMRANSQLHRQFIDEWVPLSTTYSKEKCNAIKKEIGGKIHPLMLKLRGPGNQFLKDLQGQDIVVFSITHPQLLSLNPSTIRDLMLIGRPNSSLVVHDQVSQGRHRCWFERDIMLWYAACLAIDQNGNRITNWEQRHSNGRRSIYKAFGFGKDQYQPILGTDLRDEVLRLEKRSIIAFNYFESIYNENDNQKLLTLFNDFNFKLFGKQLKELKQFNYIDNEHPQQPSNDGLIISSLETEIDLLIQYEQRVLLANRSKKRDFIIREHLQELLDYPSIVMLSPLHWLSIGGFLLLNGTTIQYQNRILKLIQSSYEKINNLLSSENEKKQTTNFIGNQTLNDLIFKDLLSQQLAPSKAQFKDRKGKMFSVKASEDHVESGVTRRKELLIQSKKNQIMKSRSIGFNSIISPLKSSLDLTIDSIKKIHLQEIHENILKLSQSSISTATISTPSSISSSTSIQDINIIIGKIFKLSILSLESIVNLVYSNLKNQEIHQQEKDKEEKENLLSFFDRLCINGNEIDLKIWDQLIGTYETFGLITPLYEISNKSMNQNDHQAIVSIITELTSTLLLLEKCSIYLSFESGDFESDQPLIRSLAEFFAKTIDDHYSEFTPWSMDPKRYPLFTRHFDQVGIMLSSHREHQYQLYWKSHKYLYPFIRSLIINKSSIINSLKYNEVNDNNNNSDQKLIDLLLGNTNIELDTIITQAIGASVGKDETNPPKYELLWRSYNQLREIVFIKNDGFQLPRVFKDFIDPYLEETLNCSKKVNHCFLSPVGRTHYASSMTEGPTLSDNLFITRDGNFVSLPDGGGNSNGTDKSVLTINDAFYWINLNQYKYYLSTYSKLSTQQINQRIEKEINEKVIIVGKGVLVASRFIHPIIIGSIVTLHHHRLESQISNAGYPTTDKSPFLYEMTYNKSLYPLIFNSNNGSHKVNLPQEIDWLQIETTKHHGTHQELMKKIEARLLPFVKQYPIIIVKGAAESGARNLSRFDCLLQQDNEDQDNDNKNDKDNNNNNNNIGIKLCSKSINNACEFILHISKSQNVVIQRAIIASPLFWMSHRSIKRMIERQINDYGIAVELNRFPKDSIYGSVRLILSSSKCAKPNVGDNDNLPRCLDDPLNWQTSHPISLNSLQIATNVGRQGSLEILNPQLIKSSLRQQFLNGLEEAGRNVMSDISKFGPIYWNQQIELYKHSFESYHERFPSIKEFDALGTPIWWPRYLMLDFIPEPVWKNKETGEIVESCRLIDITIPPTTLDINDEDEKSIDNCGGSVYLLKDLKSGKEFQGEVKSIKFWHLEPNVGVGLWTNSWKREIELHTTTINGSKSIDWSKIGHNDRIVLSNFLTIGKQFLTTIPQQLFDYIKNINNFNNLDSNSKNNVKSKQYKTIEINNNDISKSLTDNLKNSNLDLKVVFNDDPKEFIEKCIEKCKEYLKINPYSFGEFIDKEKEMNEYLTRISQRYYDSLISEELTPPVLIVPPGSEQNKLIKRLTDSLLGGNNSFAVVVGKSTLMNHHYYPFTQSYQQKITTIYKYEEKFKLNVICCHKDWIEFDNESNSAFIKRCQLLMIPNDDGQEENNNDEIIYEFNLPLLFGLKLKLSSCFILELLNGDYQDQELSQHRQLSQQLQSHDVLVMNEFEKSKEHCDDKFWLKSQLSKWFLNGELKSTPPIAILNLTSNLLNERDILLAIEKQSPQLLLLDLNTNSNSNLIERGLILQPRSNTTESNGVEYFKSPNSSKKLVSRVLELIDQIDTQDHLNGDEYLVSQVIDSVRTKSDQKRLIFRLNACIGNETTLSIVKAGSSDELIISPGVRGSKWVLVQSILNDLPIPIKKRDWLLWCDIAQNILEEIDLPLIGIDMILTYDSINQQYIPYILEANARPGSLIMAEKLHFNEETNQFDHSTPTTPISINWWYQVQRNSHLTINDIQNIISIDLLKDRYNQQQSFDGSIDNFKLLKERKQNLINQLEESIKSHSFNPFSRVVVVCSNGRDRVFMGHSDLLGLGGFTINSNSMNEILCIGQLVQSNGDNGGKVIISNEDSKQFPTVEISIDNDIIKLLKQSYDLKSKEPLWDQIHWDSYIKCLLAYLIHKSESYPKSVINDLTKLKSKDQSILLHFSSGGLLKLPTSGGVSSSSALTGACILCLDSLFHWNLTKEQMANTDFAEYFLGKLGGASDKTTQLFSKKGKISIIGSIPERFIKSLKFPNEKIVIVVAQSHIPRLTTSLGREWIVDQIEGTNKTIHNNSVDVIYHWAHQIMKSFGSQVLIDSVNILKDKLSNPLEIENTSKITGFTDIEMKKLYLSLSKNNLLRDLSLDGEIEKHFPELKNHRLKRYQIIYKLLLLLPETKVDRFGVIEFWNRKAVLFALSELERGIVYQQIITLLANSNTDHHNGNSNGSIDKKQEKQLIKDLMKIIKTAHDGDKQIQDYRNGFKETPWSINPLNCFDDDTISTWIGEIDKILLITNPLLVSNGGIGSLNSSGSFDSFKNNSSSNVIKSSPLGISQEFVIQKDKFNLYYYLNNPNTHHVELSLKCGGFQRSLPDFDEMADEMTKIFKEKAALRISAAGLGGCVCVHTTNKKLNSVISWLNQKNFINIRKIDYPGPPSQSLFQ